MRLPRLHVVRLAAALLALHAASCSESSDDASPAASGSSSAAGAGGQGATGGGAPGGAGTTTGAAGDGGEPGGGGAAAGGGGSAGAGSGGDAGGAAGGSGTSAGGAGGSSGGAAGGSGGAGGGGAAVVDLDGDGLDDAFEAEVAASYLPFLSLDPNDGCPLGGIVYRVYPHPTAPTLLAVVYDHLFENDCGLGGHVGDNEVFGITVDTSKPAPEGIVAMKAASHQGTFCEKVSECGACPGLSPCTTADLGGEPTPVVFTSKDKHATYVTQDACTFTLCLDACTLAPSSSAVPLVNAGEPSGHLTENLTTGGFITAANGWTATELMNFDPWDAAKDFGSAGNVADDLVDPTFVAAACP